MVRRADPWTLAAFIAVVVIGGTNFVAVSFSNQELPPLFGAALRFGVASVLFFLLGRLQGVPLARGRAAVGAAIYGSLAFGAMYAGLYYALVGLTAGTTSVIVAASPLFTLLLAVVVGQERFTRGGVIGALLVIAGIAVLSRGSIAGPAGWAFMLAAVAATAAGAASGVVAKALPKVHPLNMNAVGMAVGTLILAAGSIGLGERWALPSELETWLAVAWLVIGGSIGLFWLVLYVIRRWSASAATFAVAGMPVVATVLGAILLDQPVTFEVLVGGGLVFTAILVGALAGAKAADDGAAGQGST
jgi:drug/metabolite transporter (DMT)-like permease